MAIKDFETGEEEKSTEVRAEEKREQETEVKEKKLKKPGSISRFFNQFGIGKYWERLNNYFEQEEKMEKEAAEREASKETAEDIKATAESEVNAVKEKGAELPKQIEEIAARAGAENAEIAPIVAEAKAEEATIEKEAEGARVDLGREVEDIEIVEKESLEDNIRKEYKDASVNRIDARIKSLGLTIKSEADEDARELLEVEQDILSKLKKEKMPAKVQEKKLEVKLPAWDEVEAVKKVKPLSAEDLPPVEGFETEAKEYKERAVPAPEKVKPVEAVSEEVIEMPPEIEEIKPITSKEIEATIKSKKWEIKPPTGFKTRLPEVYASVEDLEKAFMAKGERDSKARIEKMVNSLAKVGEAYVKQKAVKEMSPKDEKALRKWIAETKGLINVMSQSAEEMKPVKPVKLKKRKKAA